MDLGFSQKKKKAMDLGVDPRKNHRLLMKLPRFFFNVKPYGVNPVTFNAVEDGVEQRGQIWLKFCTRVIFG